MMTSDWHKSPPRLGLRMQIANFIILVFPKQQNEKNTNAEATQSNRSLRTKLGGEFWACDAIMHKTY